ncbi:MAG TPA: DoxX-like family protein [Chthoniobacterales bacterium]|nr:DoxX-like family protein [Chthoniobacterales bacterium]
MTQRTTRVSGAFIGAVWVFHGLYSKLLNGFPRHREIVARVVGEELATPVTKLVGAGEVLLGLWTWSGRARKPCAAAQSAALVSMNALEISRANDLLVSGRGMLILNALLLAMTWRWAAFDRSSAETTTSHRGRG